MKFVSFVILSLGFILTSCNIGDKKEDTPKAPNFLFVLVDDQPFDALGVNGRYPFLQTPNMDRLAKEGVLFENYFCTQSICSPSRASFLTGTYAHIHGVNQNNRHVDPDWNRFKPYTQLLQEAGYQTAHVGKIHMAHKKGAEHIRPGFDYWFSFNGQGEYFDPMVNDNGREYQEKGYMTDILTEKAITWLKEKRDKSKPFSLNLWHKAVHEDHSPAPRHEQLYDGEELPEPPHGMLNETFAGKPEWQRIKAADAKWKEYVPVDSLPIKKWPVKGDKFMRLLKTLKAVDESLGEVLATLEEIGELENTVIIYSSDNGYFMGEHGYWDKRIAYEASMRIPMLIRYPKLIQSETKIEELCLNVDLAPTILELAGVQKPEYMQGESMLDLLGQKKDTPWRETMLFQYYVDDAYPYAGPDMLAVRTDKYKLVDCFLENDIDELYDLENDPGEMNNLIGKTEYAEVEKQLREEIERLKLQYNYNRDRDWWLRQVAQKKE
nr:sulfatase [uncultured Draconibacterium sp.]